jgi:hypothetical protein
MSNERFEVTKYEDHPEWDRIDIKKKFSEWCIESCKDGDISIECRTNDNTNILYLNQYELKQLIEFLQSKLMNNDKQ